MSLLWAVPPVAVAIGAAWRWCSCEASPAQRPTCRRARRFSEVQVAVAEVRAATAARPALRPGSTAADRRGHRYTRTMFNVGGGELHRHPADRPRSCWARKRLPDAARQIGKAMGDLRRLSTGFQNEVRTALDTADDPNQVAARATSSPARPSRRAPRRAVGPPAAPDRRRRRARTTPPVGAQPSARRDDAPPSRRSPEAPRQDAAAKNGTAAAKPTASKAAPRAPRPDEHRRASRWSPTTAACRSWSTSRSSATGSSRSCSRSSVGMVVALRPLRPDLRLPHRALRGDRQRRRQRRSTRRPAAPGRSARGLRGAHEAGALRRHRHRHAGDPLAALAVRHAGPVRRTRSATRSRSS